MTTAIHHDPSVLDLNANDCVANMLRSCFKQQLPPVKMRLESDGLGPRNTAMAHQIHAARAIQSEILELLVGAKTATTDYSWELWGELGNGQIDFRPQFIEFMNDMIAKGFVPRESIERWAWIIGPMG